MAIVGVWERDGSGGRVWRGVISFATSQARRARTASEGNQGVR